MNKFQTKLQCRCNWLETFLTEYCKHVMIRIFAGVFCCCCCFCFLVLDILFWLQNFYINTRTCNLPFSENFTRSNLMMSWIKFNVSGSPSETWSLNCDIAKITIRVCADVSNFKHVAEKMLLRKFSNRVKFLLENSKLSYSCSKFLFGGRRKWFAFPIALQAES